MKFECVDTNERLVELYPSWMGASEISIDTETSGLDIMDDFVCGVCVSVDGEKGYYVPFAHISPEPQCSPLVVKFVLSTLIRNPHLTKIFHNSKYDIHLMMNTFGIRAIPPFQDTMIAGFVVDNTVPKGLKPWCARLFGDQLPLLKEDLTALRKAAGAPSFAHLHPSQIADYGAADALFTFKLWRYLEPQLKVEHQTSLYRTEVELMEFVWDMERNGVLINQGFLRDAGRMLEKYGKTVPA